MLIQRNDRPKLFKKIKTPFGVLKTVRNYHGNEQLINEFEFWNNSFFKDEQLYIVIEYDDKSVLVDVFEHIFYPYPVKTYDGFWNLDRQGSKWDYNGDGLSKKEIIEKFQQFAINGGDKIIRIETIITKSLPLEKINKLMDDNNFDTTVTFLKSFDKNQQ